jgi:hypothetical protein
MSNPTTTNQSGNKPLSNLFRIALPILILVCLTAAVSAAVYYHRLRTPTVDDYDTHVLFTLRLLKHDFPPTFVLAHPALQLILGFLYWAGRGHIDIFDAAAFVQVVAQVATVLILYFWLGPFKEQKGRVKRVATALTLTLVAPIMLLAPLDGLFYFGYIGLANYHNPTVHLLRPLALLSFIFVVRAFTQPRSPAWMIVLSAALMIAGALVKPNFAMSILPVLGLAAAWKLWRREPFDTRLVLLGLALPALLMLALQTVVVYLIPDADASGITIAPFAVESVFSQYLPVKFLLSAAFPLIALLFFWRQSRSETSMQLAWLCFLSGALQLYLLAETGDRFFHGNFRWSAQITLFLLFAATARFLLMRGFELPTWQRRLVWAIYLLHFAAGVAYYIASYIRPGYA